MSGARKQASPGPGNPLPEPALTLPAARLHCLDLAVRFAGGSPARAIEVADQFEAYVRGGHSPVAAPGEAGDDR